MKTKFKIARKVLRIPNRDEFMIQTQYTEGGVIFTDDNKNKGYSEDAAMQKLKSKEDPLEPETSREAQEKFEQGF